METPFDGSTDKVEVRRRPFVGEMCRDGFSAVTEVLWARSEESTGDDRDAPALDDFYLTCYANKFRRNLISNPNPIFLPFGLHRRTVISLHIPRQTYHLEYHKRQLNHDNHELDLH